LIEQVYPDAVRHQLEEFLDDGALTISANPGAGVTELIRAIAPDTVVLQPREAGTAAGLRTLFARELVARAAARLQQRDIDPLIQPEVVGVLALDFGRRAPDVVALAQGEVDRDLSFAELAERTPRGTVIAVDNAHLVDSVAGAEALWGLRDHRRVVLATRPWFVDRLRRSDAPFFGHGRTMRLSGIKLRPPIADPLDAAFVSERAAGNAELAVEILQRGEGDVRHGWGQAVEARRSVRNSLLAAAFAVHHFGPALLRAIAVDKPPYGAIPEAPSARVATALRALRDNDFVYPPRARRWRLADPALAAALSDEWA
jgi:hypothetical protein